MYLKSICENTNLAKIFKGVCHEIFGFDCFHDSNLSTKFLGP